MSVQTMTAAKFGGVTRNGITFVEFEDGDTWCALGHVDPAGMAEAVNEWFRETAGSLGEPETFDADVVEHLWAIEVQPTHPVSDSEWWLTWRDAKDAPVTKETPGLVRDQPDPRLTVPLSRQEPAMSEPAACGHCQKTRHGYATAADGTPLCHPLGVFEDPNNPPPPDCYHLVTVYGHPMPCPDCPGRVVTGRVSVPGGRLA